MYRRTVFCLSSSLKSRPALWPSLQWPLMRPKVPADFSSLYFQRARALMIDLRRHMFRSALNLPVASERPGPPLAAWLAVPFFLTAVLALWVAGDETLYEAPFLLLALNFLFAVLPALAIAVLFGGNFYVTGAPGPLLFGCGGLMWACSGLAPLFGARLGLALLDTNKLVTIHNLCVWCASLCYFAGAALLQRLRAPLAARTRWLAGLYLAALGLAAGVIAATMTEWTPPFFAQHSGGAPVRQFVLVSTIFMIALAIALLREELERRRSRFIPWFILSLSLLAVGYLGLILQPVLGGALGWVSRGAQFVAGAYMLAALEALREGDAPFEAQRSEGKGRHPLGVAIAAVLIAAVLRVVFLHGLGGKFAFITFYPAVMLAALYGGFWPGAAAAGVATALVFLYHLEPYGSFVTEPVEALGVAIFVANSLLLSYVADRLQRASALLNKTEAARRQELERLVAERTAELTREIATRRRIEDQLLLARAEAERAGLAKAKFLAAASHDLRQPVQSLVMLLAALKRQTADQPDVAPTVSMMKSAIEGVKGLLSGILDISRLDAGVVAPAMSQVDVGDLIARLAKEYEPAAQAKGLRLRCAPRPLWAHSDRVLLERMIRNLVENALRYTAQGGVLIAARACGARVRIDVVDTGAGIPAEKQAEVFEEFHQLDNPGRDSNQGLGLGLAIVARLAKLLGVEVGLASRPGRGSRFSLVLPQSLAAADAPVETRPAIADPGGRILVVEDNQTLRQAYVLMLRDCGYEVLAAASGEAAMEAVARENHHIDAILADYRLGAGLSGPDAAREIARRAGRAIPCIVLTGDTAKERIAEVRANDFTILHKPVGVEDLRQELARILLLARAAATARA